MRSENMTAAELLPDAIVRVDDAGNSHAIFTLTVNAETTAWEVVSRVSGAFDRGVKSVWVVFQNVEKVLVFTSPTQVRVLTRADELTGDPLVPGFRVAMADLFPLAEPAA
jgi:hypothetical protein